MKDKRKPESWYFDFLIVTIISFLTYTTNQILNNSTALYVVSLGSDTMYGGMLISIFTISALVARILTGRLIDQRGCRIVSIVGAGIFSLFIFFFVQFPALMVLPVWRVFQGIGFAAVGTASGAAVSNILPPKSMGRGIFFFGLGQSLALCFGPFIALTLINGNDFSRVYITAALIMFVTIPLSCFCHYPSVIPEERASEKLEGGGESTSFVAKLKKLFTNYIELRAIKSVIVQVMTSIAVAFIVFYLAYYSADKNFADARLFFMVASFTMVCLRLFLPSVFSRLSKAQVLTGGYTFGIGSLLIIAFARNPVVFILGGVFYGIFHGTIGPVLQTLSVESVEPSRRGAATGTYYFAVDIGMGIGSALWGALIERISFFRTDFFAILCLVVSIVLSLVFFRGVTSAKKDK